MGTDLITRPGPAPAPLTYELGAVEEIQIKTAYATFDGTGASGDFLACLTILAQSGQILSRVFPSTTVKAGNVANVSYAPFPGGLASSGGGYTPPRVYEKFNTGTTTFIANGAGSAVNFGTFLSGTQLFSTTAFTFLATALFDGIVFVSATVVGLNMTAGGTFVVEAILDNSDGGVMAQTVSPPSTATNPSPEVAITLLGRAQQGRNWQLQVTNLDGSAGINFQQFFTYATLIS